MSNENKGTGALTKHFLIATLISAALVTSFRFLHVADLGYDLTIQIQASQHLVDGKGLVVCQSEPSGRGGVISPLPTHYLTWFPCGFSLYAAALLALNIKLGLIIKIFGGSLTLIGWWGWGRLAASFWETGLGGVFWKICGFAIAILSPLFFTPPWSGTDIFLWAFVPWTIVWLTSTSDSLSRKGLQFYGLAGAVCGLCVLMRYASLFLVVGCLFVILGQSRKKWQLLAGKCGAFLFGLASTIWIQWIFVPHLGKPGGVGVGVGKQQFLTRGVEGLCQLSSVNHAFFFWAPDWTVDALTARFDQLPWQFGAAVLVLCLPLIIAWRCGAKTIEEWFSDSRVATTLMIPVLVAVLLGSLIFGSYDGFVSNPRYYWPVAPLAFYVPLYLAIPREEPRYRLTWLVRGVGVFLVVAMIISGFVRLTYLFRAGEYGDQQRQKLIGTTMSRPWPSMTLNYENYQSRNYVAEYLSQHPGTFLFTPFDSWFIADGNIDRSRLIRLMYLEDWSSKRLVGPARFLLMVPDNGVQGEVVLGWRGEIPRVVPLDRFPNARILKVFPDQKIKVIEGEVLASTSFSFDGSGRPGKKAKPGNKKQK